MNWPPRIIAIQSLLQMLFIIAGYFTTRSYLKLFDRVAPLMYGTQDYPRSGMAEFVRGWGLWMLLVPLAWCIFASARIRREGGESTVNSAQFIGGIVLTLGVVFLFSLGTLCAFRVTFGGR